ncbi:MerR family transcriptional regulator [Paenibacillus sp. 32O-W]|uniref:MerR family transcriptional regulator n=1 Tax=Paenibacillus sp. 32O-W TaxID=1695218 RepID=UPI00071F5BB9|nr:MerR family transcriptional regulator [Paenibacillus sp. 32O-W]ALS30179.1 MerR family transcriptional regulator [Paenibacillus sp. 32O-W]
MKIKEAVRLTGLTRKAIYYYEQAGLLAPATDSSNQYRIYTSDDIERLRYIRTLRRLGMPIRDIQTMLQHPEQAVSLLRKQLKRIEAAASELELCRSALSVLIEAAEQAPEDGGRSRIREADLWADAAEQERKRRDDYMRRKLMELFPGTMGKFMALHFGAFLHEPLAGEDKESAWKRLVDYVDGIEPFDIPPALAAQIDRMSEAEIEEAAAAYRESLQRFISPTEPEYESLKEEMRRQAEQFGKLPFNREQVALTRQLKDSLDRVGFYDVFVEQMRILSADYRNYLETLGRLQRDLNLRYDDYGMLTI